MNRVITASCERARNLYLATRVRRVVDLRERGPMTSFTFDDFPRSAYEMGGLMLEARGWRATYYTAMGLMNGAGHGEAMFDSALLHRLLAAGHEIGCHTFGHVDIRGLSAAAIDREIDRNAEAVSRVLSDRGGVKLSSFAYPFGSVSIGGKRAVRRRFGSGRTIRRGINQGRIDLSYLRANSLNWRRVTPGQIEDLVDENVRARGWLIFYTHDVRESPGPWGCTPELLRVAIEAMASSGSRVLPVGEVVTLLATGLP